METTGRLPALIEDAPELWPHLEIVWRMFRLVSSSRSTTFDGLWYIHISEIVAVLDLFGIQDIDTRLYYAKLLQYADGVYLKHWHETHSTKK